ncbi:MAG: hypothetical protein KC620_19490, partial [Myxococcales bacterium]|nr:hypothetical protein [Myxococcales bacterium]
SLAPHVGGLLVGGVVVRRLGWPAHAWGAAWIASIAMWALTFLLTGPAANVNLSHAPPPPLDALPPGPDMVVFFLLLGAIFAATERAFSRPPPG